MRAHYWTHEEMWEELRRLETAYPGLIAVEVMGHSREGRELPAVTLTNMRTGWPHHKSAVLVDANIHAGEVAGNATAIYWLQWCLETYGVDPQATELLDRHTLYVIPRIAADGAELYLTTAARLRSSPRNYPFSEPPEGFVESDVDGDGRILQMRVLAADGGFVKDEIDPRVMRPRAPGEIGGDYYHVLSEGQIERTSLSGPLPAFSMSGPARRHGMDFNRNFPIRWAGEKGQAGAGPYPLSEPELRALADFIQAHPNIAAYAALHTTGGVILRQPSTGDETVLSETDRELFTRVAETGAKVSGYYSGSNHAIFASGHEKILMPGAADDWMYDHLGVLGFTVEIWNPSGRAGARSYGELGVRKMMTLTPEEHTEDHRKLWAWADREVGQDGVFAWKACCHPDFGQVEIGGLDPKFVLQNPPPHLLEEECARTARFLTLLGLSTPLLTTPVVTVTCESEGVFRIVAEVANAGFLPTSSTQKGHQLLLEGVRASLQGPVTILAGTSPVTVGHLDGYGDQSVWATPKRQRAHAEWVVRAAPDTCVVVAFEGVRAGRTSTVIPLT